MDITQFLETIQSYCDAGHFELTIAALINFKHVHPTELPSVLSSIFEAAFQSHEFKFAVNLFVNFPEIVHLDYISSPLFADTLFQTIPANDSLVKLMFEEFGVPRHIQSHAGLNLFEYSFNLEEMDMADYAHKVLGLTTDKPDMVLGWGAMMGNKLMLRYLHNDVGLQLRDTETFLEQCARSARSDMIEFAFTEMGISTVETLGPLVAAVERAWEISELKPLTDLLDRFVITADVTMLKEVVEKDVQPRMNVDDSVRGYLKEVLNLEIKEEC